MVKTGSTRFSVSFKIQFLKKTRARPRSRPYFYVRLHKLLDDIACFLNGQGESCRDLGLGLLAQLVKLGSKCLKGCNVAAADLERAVDEQVCYVMVACKNTCNEAIEGLCIKNSIIVCIDKSRLMLYVKAELCSFFKTYNVTGRSRNSLVHHRIDNKRHTKRV